MLSNGPRNMFLRVYMYLSIYGLIRFHMFSFIINLRILCFIIRLLNEIVCTIFVHSLLESISNKDPK
jgi:MFS-type transporter involved in bile tolerance (Atg22 family)